MSGLIIFAGSTYAANFSFLQCTSHLSLHINLTSPHHSQSHLSLQVIRQSIDDSLLNFMDFWQLAADFSKLKLFSEDQNLPTITPPPTTATTDVPIVGKI